MKFVKYMAVAWFVIAGVWSAIDALPTPIIITSFVMAALTARFL